MIDKKCQVCKKQFFFYPHRIKENPRYCSSKCRAKEIMPNTRGLKFPAMALARMGNKNPMVIHGIKPEHLQALREGAKKYQDSIRVSKEHKRMVKKILAHKRRAMFKGTFTHGQWLQLKNKYGNRCPSCTRSEPFIVLTIDHITPISRGGTNTIENIQPLCRSCNSKKNNRSNKKYEIVSKFDKRRKN